MKLNLFKANGKLTLQLAIINPNGSINWYNSGKKSTTVGYIPPDRKLPDNGKNGIIIDKRVHDV